MTHAFLFNFNDKLGNLVFLIKSSFFKTYLFIYLFIYFSHKPYKI